MIILGKHLSPGTILCAHTVHNMLRMFEKVVQKFFKQMSFLSLIYTNLVQKILLIALKPINITRISACKFHKNLKKKIGLGFKWVKELAKL